MKVAKILAKSLVVISFISVHAFATEPSLELMASCVSTGTGEPVALEVYVDPANHCRGCRSFPGYMTFYGPDHLLEAKVNYGPKRYSVVHEDYQLRFDEFKVPGEVSATLTIRNAPDDVEKVAMTCDLPEYDRDCQ